MLLRPPARDLVRLHADQHHHAGIGRFDQPGQAIGTDMRIGLIEKMDSDIHVAAQHVSVGAVPGDAGQRRQRVGGYGGAEPLDDIAVVVVVRRLEQHETKTPVQNGSSTREANTPGQAWSAAKHPPVASMPCDIRRQRLTFGGCLPAKPE